MNKKLFYFSYDGPKPFGKYLPIGEKLYVNFKLGQVYGISIIKGEYFEEFPKKIILHIKNHGKNEAIFRIEKKLYTSKKTLISSISRL